MKLLMDIGNTNCTIALSDKGSILKKYFIHTSKKEVQPAALRRLLGGRRGKIDDVVIVSVVPAFLRVFKKSISSVLPGVKVRIVGRDIKVPIPIKYRKPEEVGQDRLVTAYAAMGLLGSPVIAIDFGTAVTMDYVNSSGAYEGGLIFPGLRLALASLSEEAALLPSIDLRPAKSLLGKDTASSMNNGILYGYSSMCDGIVDRFRKRLGKKLRVIATGGDAELVSRYSRSIKKVRPDLILEGLMLLIR
ncbi:MAG: type III pantothenate kinase [Candidatus Omnitrophica bacterium]|nr:type III pantothenate kinase [Candidatus Omnitrophota bacterium]